MKMTAAPTIMTIMLLSTAALAQQSADVGRADFEASCAVCHGFSGKGDGMVAPGLRSTPPDLTVLSRNNAGAFPMSRVKRVIDGRWHALQQSPLPNASGAHDENGFIGSFNETVREMPVWGRRLSELAAEHYFDVPYDQEQYIERHVQVLADYLYRIQEK